jgi:HSP20 family protein
MNQFLDEKDFDEFADSEWLSHSEGQLSVDVIETKKEIIVRSAIAGISAEDLDISLSEDTLTVRGERHHNCEISSTDRVHVEECHWGAFSRSIILPSNVDPDSVDAVLKRGILTITMSKQEMDKSVPVLDLGEV